jgi:hypothetical protein
VVANIHLGNGDSASPVAQTLGVSNVVAGTSNTLGQNFTITGSQGTGTGAGGSILFQTAPGGLTGTSQNALATAMTIAGSGYVGIGTSSPAYRFTVQDPNALNYSGVEIQQIAAGEVAPFSQATVGTGLGFLYGGSPIAGMYVSNSGTFLIETNSGGDVGLGPSNSGTGMGVSAFEFLGSGNLTTAPAFTTHVGSSKEAGYAGDSNGNLFLITDRLQRFTVLEGSGYVGIGTATIASLLQTSDLLISMNLR